MVQNKKQETRNSSTDDRRIELPKRHWYNPSTWLRNLPIPPRRKISSVRKLVQDSLSLLRRDWRTFGGISLVYAVGVIIFVRSFSVGTSSVVASVTNGIGSKISDTVSQVATLLANANSSLSAASSVYQIIISTICSLACIWAFRQLLSGKKASTKQSFYQGMTPLVKYLLILVMFGVQLLPIAAGGYLFNVIVSSGAFFGWELWVTGLVFIVLALWSVRLITHTLFALFITTLPDMTPIQALRSAKKMVYRRRLIIWRKLFGAMVLAAIVALLLMSPFVLWWGAAAPWMVYILSVLVVPISQAYLYTLYREIL